VPFPLSVTEDNDPSVVESVTVAPPVVILFPFASFNCTVMTVVLEPFAVIVFEAAVIVEVAVLAGPAVKFTASLSAIAELFNVPLTVAVPVLVTDVNVAVYVPFPLSVTDVREPSVVFNAIVAPPEVRLLPFASFS
jgi:hypothetical protein